MDNLRKKKGELLLYREQQEKLHGKDHSQVLATKLELVKLHRKLRDYEKAISFLKEIVHVKEKKLGKQHLGVLKLKNGLVDLYIKQGMLTEADALLSEVIRIEARLYPEGNSTALMTVFYLAILRREQNKYKDAKFLFEKVLELNKLVPERKRISPFTVKHELIILYWQKVLFRKAESLCLEVLRQEDSIEKNILLKINETLVDIYISLEKYEKAKKVCTKVLTTKKHLLGMKHPSTLIVTNKLALIYMYLGNYKKAQNLCHDVLLVQERILPRDHLDILVTKSTLADIYQYLEELEKASRLHQEVLDARKERLGTEHHDTVEAMNRLGLTYVSWDQFDKAGECLFEALLISEEQTKKDEASETIIKDSTDGLFSMGGTEYETGFFSSIFHFLGKK